MIGIFQPRQPVPNHNANKGLHFYYCVMNYPWAIDAFSSRHLPVPEDPADFCFNNSTDDYSAGRLISLPRRIIAAAFVVLVLLVLAGPVTADVPSGTGALWPPSVAEGSLVNTNISMKSCISGTTAFQHPLMHFTQKQLNEMQRDRELSPQYSAPFPDNGIATLAGSRNLLPYISYSPAERDQGNCGDCWVWAGTGALEVEHAVKNGINKRLSVQYFNSKFKNGAGTGWACCGGWTSTFTSWYNADKTVLPWSNTNAGFGDRSQFCEDYQTSIPIGSIALKPRYTLNSLSYQLISTNGTSQTAAITNIKSALNANKAVIYGFWYGTSGWNDFNNFWDKDNESSIFNPVSHAGENEDGGHAVLLVGYDDTVPGSEYWLALNSWGVTANRSHGLFRVKMYMNYNATYVYDGKPYQQQTFEILNSDFAPASVPVVNFTANITNGPAPLPVSFTDKSLNNPSGWVWYFGDEKYKAPWTLLTANALWTARVNHCNVVVPNGNIVLVGGWNGGYTNDVWRSPDNGATWFQVNASPGWTPRNGQSSVALPDGSIVLMGGYDGSKKYNDVWRSTDDGTTWFRVNASAGWSARDGLKSVALPDGSIVLMGGSKGSGYTNDTWRSADKGVTWIRMNASAGWSARVGHSTVAMPDSSIVLTGGEDDSLFVRNDTWRSTDKGATWIRMTANAGWSARAGHTSVTLPDGSIVLMGGNYGSAYKNDVWRSTNNGVTWVLVNASAGWSARSGQSTIALPDGSVLLMGGVDNVGMKNDVWRFKTSGASLKNPVHAYTAPGVFRVTLQVINDFGYTSKQKVGYITINKAIAATTKVGVYRPSTHGFYLKNGSVNTTVNWGLGTDLPVSGDWNGDGLWDVGIFHNATHIFILKNGTKNTSVSWGSNTDLPVTGDWNKDGFTDVGVFRPSNHRFYLRNGTVTTSVDWGISTDLPVSGDWNGDGLWDIGVFRSSTHRFYLKNRTANTSVAWGLSTDLPVSGDWNGDGLWDIGVFRPSTHRFYLKNGTANTSVSWGLNGDKPVTGKWS
jgi:PKD repeat protein